VGVNGTDGQLRIGELARRTGTNPELLRAWERRYGLLRPARTPGGFRLYSSDDERRIERMKRELAGGLSAAQAAQLALAGGEEPAETAVGEGDAAARAALLEALGRYDEPEVQALLDRLFASFGIATIIADVVFPLLRDIGTGWRDGTVSVAQEHFASALLRGRLLGFARDWDRGNGPRALLACPAGERHDLGLIGFGLLLRREGWRILFLGADTPLDTAAAAARDAGPAAAVLSAVDRRRFRDAAAGIALLARETPVTLGGPAAREAVAAAVGAVALPADPVEAAALLTREYGRRSA
jgi:MerR family transcriptional regulator, light-induced transcriptional regulator